MAPDAIVIGAGFAGLVCAAELGERGLRVLVLEKDDVGFEQSGRAFGAVTLPDGRARTGGERSVLRAAADGWEAFGARWDCDVELNRGGWLIASTREREPADLRRDDEFWSQSSYYDASEQLTGMQARERYPALGPAVKALTVRSGGHVNPLLALRALERAVLRQGGEIRRGTLAHGFERDGERVTAVRAGGERLACGAVVVAAGMWSARVCDALGYRIPLQRVCLPQAETCPVAGDLVPGVLRTESVSVRQAANGTLRISGTGAGRDVGVLHDLSLDDLRDLRTWAPALRGHRREVRLRLSGRLLARELSARVRRRPPYLVGHEWPTDRAISRRKLRGIVELIPALAGVRIHRWFAGAFELTPDLEPVVGVVPGTANAHVLGGFSGHGLMLGLGAAQALAELVAAPGAEPSLDLTTYDPLRFQAGPLRMREQMF